MLTVAAPLLVAIVGVLAYALSASPKLAELGRVAYACGLLVVLLVLAHGVVRWP